MAASSSQQLHVDEVVGSGQLSLLIFQPDAVASKVVGPIERWLRERTGCVPIARCWLTRSDEELRRFYPDVAVAPFWPLIARTFLWGPGLATLWFGEQAARVIPASKGVTQPARCPELTVRGRFWCDNALTNLVHVSDAAEEVAREIGVLRASRSELFRELLPAHGLAPLAESEPPAPLHCAIWTLCSLLMKQLAACSRAYPVLPMPPDESARATVARAEAWLEEVRPSLPAVVAPAVAEYLEGTSEPQRLLLALKSLVPVSEWQELVLTGGVLSRPEWLEARAASASAGA